MNAHEVSLVSVILCSKLELDSFDNWGVRVQFMH